MNSTKDNSKQRRRFFLMVAFALVAFGGWKLYKGKVPTAQALFLAGTCLVMMEFLLTSVAALVFRGWMAFAQALGTINTYLLLTVVFLALITPIALLKRLFSKPSPYSDEECRKKRSSWQELAPGGFSRESYHTPY